MGDKPPTLPPASEPFPGSRTPGWNDPPALQCNQAAGRTRLLNKRVAFPLQNTDTNMNAAAKPTAIVAPSNLGGAGLPPPPMSLPPSAPAAGASQPIAVVHPMPNLNAPPPSMTATPIFMPPTHPTTRITTATAATSERSAAPPRIFVPPHQEDCPRPAAAVQHI